MFALLLLLLAGAVLGSIVNSVFTLAAGAEAGAEYGMLLSYPLMFVPPMIYAAVKSQGNSYNREGVMLDTCNFAPVGGWRCALLVAAATVAASFCSDAIGSLLPQMPQSLRLLLESMTQGNFLVNFICVSVFAPLLEEWLCRGMVLRGLLHNSRLSPAWAIIVSALFFAIIHANPWQAVPAFLLGCLFGYVYYRTGSLRLTMLMHFTNNTMALVISNIDALKDYESWTDLLPGPRYWVLFAFGLTVIALVVMRLRTIPIESRAGGSRKVPAVFESGPQ